MRAGIEKLQAAWLTIAFVSLAACLSFSAVAGGRGVAHVWRLRAELARTGDENFRLLQTVHGLRRQLSRIRNDDTYLERLARRRLSLARPGELLYRLEPERGGALPRPEVPHPAPR